MKAEVSQQRLLLEVAEVDAALTRLTHRSTHLVEQQRFDASVASLRSVQDPAFAAHEGRDTPAGTA